MIVKRDKMTDKEWLRKRKIETLEKYLCLLAVLLMVYGLFFNLLFLIRFFGGIILLSIATSIHEIIQIMKEKKLKH